MTLDRTFEIREAHRDHVPALAALHVATFKEAHGQRGAPNYELRQAQWRTAFEHGLNWFCYVAEASSGQLVEFAKGELHDGGVPRPAAVNARAQVIQTVRPRTTARATSPSASSRQLSRTNANARAR